MELKPGARLRSTVCSTEVVVVRPAPVALSCGGQPMILREGEDLDVPKADESDAAATLLGKRYADPASGLEVLCTRAGAGTLSLGDTPLELKQAKPLPSSD